jgi:tetratricopeptide (TPR) repeat protein
MTHPALRDFPTVAAVFILMAAGLVAYSNAIFHPFVHDDVVFIQQNPRIQQINLTEVFLTNPHESLPASRIQNVYYRPLLDLFYHFGYRMFGLNPHGFHFLNIGIHITNAVLIFFLLKLFSVSAVASLLGALIFMLHPIQSEAVACISGISNVLSTFLIFFSAFCYIKSTVSQHKCAVLIYLSSLVFFALALLTKEQAIVLPVIFIWYECIFTRKDPKRNRRKLRVLGACIVLMGYFWFRHALLGSVLPAMAHFSSETVLRWLSIPRIILMYGGLIFFPADLHYYRSVDILQPFAGSLLIFISLAALMVIAILKLRTQSRNLVLFGLGWSVLTFLPVSNIIPLVNEYSFIFTAEHFIYPTLVGIMIMVIGVFQEGSPLFKVVQGYRKTFFWSAVVVLSVCLGLTWNQNRFWKSEIALFERAVKYQNKLGRVHLLLGKAYYFDGKIDQAISEFKKAYEIMESYARQTQNLQAKRVYLGFMKGILIDMAQGYQQYGDFPKVIEHYQKALRIDPQSAVLLNGLGVIYLGSDDYLQAQEMFQKSLKYDGNNLTVKNNLAICYTQLGKKDEAVRIWEKILEVDPQFTAARQNLNRANQDGE